MESAFWMQVASAVLPPLGMTSPAALSLLLCSLAVLSCTAGLAAGATCPGLMLSTWLLLVSLRCMRALVHSVCSRAV